MNDESSKNDDTADEAIEEQPEADDRLAAEADDAPGNGGQSGPTFTEAPDPLAGVRRWFGGAMDSMEGKTVSMKTYVGTIIGVIILMMLSRCGG